MTVHPVHEQGFPTSMLSRAYTKVPPAQLATAEGPADNLQEGVDMVDGMASRRSEVNG